MLDKSGQEEGREHRKREEGGKCKCQGQGLGALPAQVPGGQRRDPACLPGIHHLGLTYWLPWRWGVQGPRALASPQGAASALLDFIQFKKAWREDTSPLPPPVLPLCPHYLPLTFRTSLGSHRLSLLWVKVLTHLLME